MDRIVAPTKSKVDARIRRLAPYTLTEQPRDRRSNPHEADRADEPLQRRRTIMSNSHRRFHKRAPQAGSNIKTVNVEVVATVDTAGNVVAQTTVTQPDSSAPADATQALPIAAATDVSAPPPAVPTAAGAAAEAASTPEVPSIPALPAETQPAAPSTPSQSPPPSLPQLPAEPTVASFVLPSVPAVPAVPSVALPSVPSVPPFPSTLTVPAYPFASSVAAFIADAVSVSSSAASSEPAVVAALTAPNSASTTMSTSASSVPTSSSTPSSSMGGFTFSSSPSSVVAASRSVVSSRASPSVSTESDSPSTTRFTALATPTESLDAAGSSSFYGSGGPGWNAAGGIATGASSTATNSAAKESDATGPLPLETPQVVGSVVGSLAGAALILAIILILLRRHKRRQGGALQLTDSHPSTNEPAMSQAPPPRQLQAPPRASLVPSAFLNRFSGMSRSTIDTAPSERSFQRVSGRKLPSAFSEGMTSDQFSRTGHMSDSSFYQDDHGTYGGRGMNKEYGGHSPKEFGAAAVPSSFSKETGDTPSRMNVRPSPARTPVITHPTDNPFDDANRTLSPPMSPNPFSHPSDMALRPAALGRSLHSADGSRSSRFTENV